MCGRLADSGFHTFHVREFRAVNEVITKKMSDALQLYYTLQYCRSGRGLHASITPRALAGHHSPLCVAERPAVRRVAPEPDTQTQSYNSQHSS